MDFGITTSGERGTRWLKAAMILCFVAAAATLAYAITTADAGRFVSARDTHTTN